MNARSRCGFALMQALVVCFTLAPFGFAQGEPEDPLAAVAPSTVLTAKLTAEELTGSASLSDGSHSLKISVTNSGKRALLLDGDNVAFSLASVNESALPFDQIIKPPSKNTLPGDVVEVAGSVSTMGAIPVAVDAVNKKNNPGPAYYGKDEKRRDLAELRFGKRLLFPGETSDGELFLAVGADTTKPGQLAVPVFSHPDGSSLGKLILNVNVLAATPKLQQKPAVKSAPRQRTTEAQRLPSELENSLEKIQRAERRKQKAVKD